MNTRSFLLLPPFLEEGIKLPKKFGKGSSLKSCGGNQKKFSLRNYF